MSSLTPEALEQEIAAQTARFNELRLNPDKNVATPDALNEAKQKLAELKKALALAKNAGKEKLKEKKEGGAAGAKEAEKKKERLLLKTAKVSLPLLAGTPILMNLRRALVTLALQRCSAGSTSSASSRTASRRMELRVLTHRSSSGKTC